MRRRRRTTEPKYDLVQISEAGLKNMNGLYSYSFDSLTVNCNGFLKRVVKEENIQTKSAVSQKTTLTKDRSTKADESMKPKRSNVPQTTEDDESDDDDSDDSMPTLLNYSSTHYKVSINAGIISQIYCEAIDPWCDSDSNLPKTKILYKRVQPKDGSNIINYDLPWITVEGTEPAPSVTFITGGINPNYTDKHVISDIYQQLLALIPEKFVVQLILECCYGHCYHQMLSLLFMKQCGSKYGGSGQLHVICEKCDKHWAGNEIEKAVVSSEIDLKYISINHGTEAHYRRSSKPLYYSVPIRRWYLRKYEGNNSVISEIKLRENICIIMVECVNVYDTHKRDKKVIGKLEIGQRCHVLITSIFFNGMCQIIKPIKGWVQQRIDQSNVLQKLILNKTDCKSFKSEMSSEKIKANKKMCKFIRGTNLLHEDIFIAQSIY